MRLLTRLSFALAAGLALLAAGAWAYDLREENARRLNAILGTSSGALYAVGYASGAVGLILRSQDQGKSWQEQKSGSTQELRAIWGSAKALYVAGARGTLLRSTDGERWQRLTSGTSRDLFGLTGASAKELYAVGEQGLILRSLDSGKSWQVRDSGTAQPLYAAFARSAKEVYVAGGAGTILRSRDSGKSWQALPSGTTRTLRALWGAPGGALYAVGEAGTVLRSLDSGESWERLPPPGEASPDLFGLYGFPAKGAPALAVVGASGALWLSADGESFLARENKLDQPLLGVWGSAPESLYLVSGKGAILYTSDGGARLERRLKEPERRGH